MEATNYFLEILDVEKCKRIIDRTREGEVAILCPHYSINIQSKYHQDESLDPEQIDWDFDDLEEKLGHTLFVNDYDDLCCDPHGVMED